MNNVVVQLVIHHTQKHQEYRLPTSTTLLRIIEWAIQDSVISQSTVINSLGIYCPQKRNELDIIGFNQFNMTLADLQIYGQIELIIMKNPQKTMLQSSSQDQPSVDGLLPPEFELSKSFKPQQQLTKQLSDSTETISVQINVIWNNGNYMIQVDKSTTFLEIIQFSQQQQLLGINSDQLEWGCYLVQNQSLGVLHEAMTLMRRICDVNISESPILVSILRKDQFPLYQQDPSIIQNPLKIDIPPPIASNSYQMITQPSTPIAAKQPNQTKQQSNQNMQDQNITINIKQYNGASVSQIVTLAINKHALVEDMRQEIRQKLNLAPVEHNIVDIDLYIVKPDITLNLQEPEKRKKTLSDLSILSNTTVNVHLRWNGGNQ